MSPFTTTKVNKILSGKIGIHEIKQLALWAETTVSNKDYLWQLSLSEDKKVAKNSLWVLTHLGESGSVWLNHISEEIIKRLLLEQNSSKKRLYLQLLRDQEFQPDNPFTIKLLDFCLSKINSESEPYATRCYCIYIAFNISKKYPELILELEQHLELLSSQSLSPGLRCA